MTCVVDRSVLAVEFISGRLLEEGSFLSILDKGDLQNKLDACAQVSKKS